MVIAAGCNKHNDHGQPGNGNPVNLTGFQQTNLIANNDEYNAKLQDPTLVDAWGLAFSPSGTPWVNATFGHVSEIYTADGAIARPPVNVPSPTDSVGGMPIGIVATSGKGFILSNGQEAAFLFVGGDGVFSGWNPAAGKNALLIRNNAGAAAYTGVTVASRNGKNYVYAASPLNNKIDVWDNDLKPVSLPFRDPNALTGFAVFNIRLIENLLYVTYTKIGPDGRGVKGTGNGFVDIFDTDGKFQKRFATQGLLDNPWGLTLASSAFLQGQSTYGDDYQKGSGGGYNPSSTNYLLVGNFGDGRINVYSTDGVFEGQLQTKKDQPITIDGLWDLSFPPTSSSIDPNRLYFTAGPDDEKDGLFGYITK